MFFGKTKEQKITTVIVVILIIAVCIIVYHTQNSKEPIPVSADSEFTVHIIDVGQGNAAFIDNGDKDILIDAADHEGTETVLEYLDELQVEDIEYFFITHPHEDHIATADEILERYTVANVVMPETESDSFAYKELMDAIENSYAELIYAGEGDSFTAGNASIDIYSPQRSADFSDLNLYSFIMRIEYENSSFLFTGDAESTNESYVLKKYKKNLDSDFLCVGHHGSNSSSTKKFLDAVTPDIAVISAGEGNQYGHPHSEVLSRLDDYTDAVYRTDRDGSIVIYSDGEQVWVEE